MQAISIKKDTIRLLRFPFSLFLAPVYLFAISQVPAVSWPHAILVFVILHLLVYPASNGYNSYMDRDTSSIGGLKTPPPPPRELYGVTLVMDALAVLILTAVHVQGAIFTALYILASRAYSARSVRLKKQPWIGFITVSMFQGACVFLIVYLVASLRPLSEALNFTTLWCMLISSLIIGASYPLTQIYQHEEDRRNGDLTLSLRLGYKGTFLFSGILFLLAATMLFYYFDLSGTGFLFVLFLLFTIPVVFYFLRWFLSVRQNTRHADFAHTMRMNTVSAVCMGAYFLTIIILKQISV